jgi:uncharacterized membrane protein
MGSSLLTNPGIPFIEGLSIVRAICGFILVFFLPGFAWTLVLFHGINNIERIALSFGLSIAIVTLSIVALNLLLHVRITGLHSLLIIMGITVIALGIYTIKRFVLHR